MRLFILFVTMGILTTGYSFDSKKCFDSLARSLYHPGAVSTSTIEFSSSWGKCAMIGSIKERKQQFIAFNLDELKVDSARGNGEYAEAYANLSGCPQRANKTFSGVLQDNFTQIYGDHADHDPEAVYNLIEQIISSDPTLSKDCKTPNS